MTHFNNKHVLVTSGPTYEPIDPVRFLGNRSSGKQGHAIAEAFVQQGARVTLVTGPVTIPDPAGVTTIHVETAQEMLEAVLNALPADIAVCAAAVADWRAKHVADHKMKKREGDDTLTLHLVRNPDILATLGHLPAINTPLLLAGGGPGGRDISKTRPLIVIGFAAETENLITHARSKLTSKNADLILLNDVSNGAVFGKDQTHLIAVTKDAHNDWGVMNKTQAAQKLVETVYALTNAS